MSSSLFLVMDMMNDLVSETGPSAATYGVQLKARNGSEAWVADGLAEGTRVIVYPGAEVQDGVAVRVR